MLLHRCTTFACHCLRHCFHPRRRCRRDCLYTRGPPSTSIPQSIIDPSSIVIRVSMSTPHTPILDVLSQPILSPRARSEAEIYSTFFQSHLVLAPATPKDTDTPSLPTLPSASANVPPMSRSSAQVFVVWPGTTFTSTRMLPPVESPGREC
jgi:hypothetical protein